jgi:hypothetical protein
VEPRTVDINGKTYQLGRLTAISQLHVARRLAPALMKLQVAADDSTPLVEEGGGMNMTAIGKVLAPMAEALAIMTDQDVEYVVNTCLKVVQVKQEQGWAWVMNSGGVLMFHDLQLPDLLQLTAQVIGANLGGFFPSAPPSS